jgi:hypothetical protein
MRQPPGPGFAQPAPQVGQGNLGRPGVSLTEAFVLARRGLPLAGAALPSQPRAAWLPAAARGAGVTVARRVVVAAAWPQEPAGPGGIDAMAEPEGGVVDDGAGAGLAGAAVMNVSDVGPAGAAMPRPAVPAVLEASAAARAAAVPPWRPVIGAPHQAPAAPGLQRTAVPSGPAADDPQAAGVAAASPSRQHPAAPAHDAALPRPAPAGPPRAFMAGEAAGAAASAVVDGLAVASLPLAVAQPMDVPRRAAGASASAQPQLQPQSQSQSQTMGPGPAPESPQPRAPAAGADAGPDDAGHAGLEAAPVAAPAATPAAAQAAAHAMAPWAAQPHGLRPALPGPQAPPVPAAVPVPPAVLPPAASAAAPSLRMGPAGATASTAPAGQVSLSALLAPPPPPVRTVRIDRVQVSLQAATPPPVAAPAPAGHAPGAGAAQAAALRPGYRNPWASYHLRRD